MSKLVKTSYETPIEIGTKADDGRLAPYALFIRMRDDMQALNPSQALKLASVILETLSELPIEDEPKG